MNRAARQHRKLVRFEAWLGAQIDKEKSLPSAKTAEGKRIIRALQRDRRSVISQLELAGDAGEEHARRGRRAARLGFGAPHI